MSRFSDDFAESIPDLFYEMGESGTYTPKSSNTGRSVTFIAMDDSGRRDEQTHHTAEIRTLRTFVKRSETTGITNPQRGDRFVRASEPTVYWDFARIVSAEPSSYTLEWTSATLIQAGQLRPQSL